MSEMTPDPVFEKLARFTPDSSGIDAADVLFHAGRASARTHWLWKATVGVLIVVVSALVIERQTFRNEAANAEVIPVVVVVPVQQPAFEAAPLDDRSSEESQWRLGALLRTGDPNELPASPAVAGLTSTDPPLTPRSHNEID